MQTRSSKNKKQIRPSRTNQPIQQNRTHQKTNENQNELDGSDDTLKTQLRELYTNISSTPSFGAKIKEFLQSYNLHSVNKRITKKTFPVEESSLASLWIFDV